MDKEDVVYTHTHTHRGMLLSIKKNEILPFATKSDRERQILYGITYVWNLKNTTN